MAKTLQIPSGVWVLGFVSAIPTTVILANLIKIHGVAQVLVTRPALVTGPARWVGLGLAGAASYRCGARQALQRLGSSPKRAYHRQFRTEDVAQS